MTTWRRRGQSNRGAGESVGGTDDQLVGDPVSGTVASRAGWSGAGRDGTGRGGRRKPEGRGLGIGRPAAGVGRGGATRVLGTLARGGRHGTGRAGARVGSGYRGKI